MLRRSSNGPFGQFTIMSGRKIANPAERRTGNTTGIHARAYINAKKGATRATMDDKSLICKQLSVATRDKSELLW